MRVRVKSTTEHTHTRMHTAQANITTPFRNVQLRKRTPLDKYIDLLNQRRLLFSLASTWLRHVIIFAQFRVCVCANVAQCHITLKFSIAFEE